MIQEKVKIFSFKECYSLLNFQSMAEKKIHVTCHFPCKLIHYVWNVISPALVMEIRRNNRNNSQTCTTTQKVPIYKIQ